MIPVEPVWTLPDGVEPAAAAAAIAQALSASVHERAPRTVHLLDTFDDRLWRAGERLIVERSEAGWLVRREDARGARQPGRGVVEGVPRWPVDLPAGPLRASASAWCDVRCLLPRASARVVRWRVVVRDGRDKIVVRVLCASWTVGGAVFARASLRPVRGYPAAARAAAAALDALGAVPCDDPWSPLREATGDPPGAYPPPGAVLTPDMPAAQALREALRAQHAVLVATGPGVTDALDPEFLHEFRVAVRRSRALLKALRAAWPASVSARHAAFLKDLGGRTGPVRDLDVHRLALPGVAAALPAPMRPDLTPLDALLAADQAAAQRSLAVWLRGRTHARRMARAAQTLAASGGSRARHADTPVGALAARKARKQFHRVRRDGRAIGPATPDPVLHALRKEVKVLRYLPELLSGALEPAACAAAVRAVKPLQAVLGTLQDAAVQAEAMQGFADRLVAARAPSGTLLAMGAVVASLHGERDRARAAFASAFDAFDTEAVAVLFEGLGAEAVP